MRSSFLDDKELCLIIEIPQSYVERLGIVNARSLQKEERMKHVFLFYIITSFYLYYSAKLNYRLLNYLKNNYLIFL